jgi:DNA-binding response OmpR family regulator
MINILIVEDELIEAYYLKKILENDTLVNVVAIAKSVNEARGILEKNNINIIFMDIMLKGPIDGSTFAVEVSKNFNNIIIIFLTAYSDKEMIDNAIKSKAFAYLIKPYSPKEIEATLALAKSKILSKNNKPKSNTLKLIDGYSFDFDKDLLYKDNKLVELTKKELELIRLLSHNSNIILDSNSIEEMLNITPQALRALIYRIRNNLSKELIVNIKKYGYKINSI